MLIKPYILSIGYKESDEKASCHHLTIKPQTVLNDCISAGHFIYNMSFRSINFIFLYTVLITTATAWLQTTYHHLSFKRIIISLSLSLHPPLLCVFIPISTVSIKPPVTLIQSDCPLSLCACPHSLLFPLSPSFSPKPEICDNTI